ncbi:MAG: Rpn family recombination-promoting nuclease/putative transposase [Kovacikia sp.]
MRRDTIFYQLFQQSPSLLFELLETAPANASEYRFDAVAVKEPKFEIDGVFLPPETGSPGIIYFCEVQFQKDDRLYERFFAELFLYFYRNRERYTTWEGVIIYPSRSLEQSETSPYQSLLISNQIHRVYLDELGEIQQLPLGVALMVLTTLDEATAPAAARELLQRSQRAPQPPPQFIIEMVTTIMVYRFTYLSRQEVERMLGITLQETRVYQEAKAEGREEGRQEGREEGRQEALVHLVERLLTRRLQQELPEPVRSQLTNLYVAQLEELGEALLEWNSLTDLQNWLEAQPAT